MEKVNVPRNRREAVDLARKIEEIRSRRFRKMLDVPALLRLADSPDRLAVMEWLVEKGCAGSVGEVERMVAEAVRSVTPWGTPVESTGMSDDVLDAGVQYLNINRELL